MRNLQKIQADVLTARQQQFSTRNVPCLVLPNTSSEKDVQLNEDEESGKKPSVLRSISLKFTKKDLGNSNVFEPTSGTSRSFSSANSPMKQKDLQQDLADFSLTSSTIARLTNLLKSKKSLEPSSSRIDKHLNRRSMRL